MSQPLEVARLGVDGVDAGTPPTSSCRQSIRPGRLDIGTLQRRLDEVAEARTRSWWTRYLRGAARFPGVSTARVRDIARTWWEEGDGDRLPCDARLGVLTDLVREPATEDKLAAMLLLQDRLIPAGQVDWREALPRFAERFDDGSLADWNAGDWFCVRVLGPLIEASGDECAEAVAAWIEAPGLWRRRASLVAFVNLVRGGRYTDLVLANAARLASERERFAQTAVAWTIRELGRVDPHAAEAFLDEHGGSLSRPAMRQARGRRP